MPWDPHGYSAAVVALLLPERVPELGPGCANRSVEAQLRALTPATLVGKQRLVDTDAARACLAGLWLYHDFLDASHALSQDVPGPDGSYWHAIMHRREPDADNSKYWYRRVGRHAVFEPFSAAVRETLTAEGLWDVAGLEEQAGWDPYRWVDLCDAARRGALGSRLSAAAANSLTAVCARLGCVEWQLLFDHCYQRAVGAAD